MKQMVEKLHNKLLDNGIGRAAQLHTAWKNIKEDEEKPLTKDLSGRAANELERGLAKIAQRTLKSAFDPFKEDLVEG